MKKRSKQILNRLPVCWSSGGATVLLFLLALAFAGCKPEGSSEAPKRSGPPISVKTIQPKRGEIIRYVTLPGAIRANQQVTLYAKVAGYLKSLNVDKGDRVQAGQSLGEIELPELLADEAQYKAETAVSRTNYERMAEARQKAPDLVVPQTVDDLRGQWEVAQAKLQRTQTLLQYARIVAPFAGVVTARFVDPGAFIPAATSGSTAQTAAIVAIADFTTVRAQVALPEVEASLAQVGQPVKLTVEGLAGKTFQAKITRLSYALDEATRTMVVEADLPNPDLALRPGMYAIVKVGVDSHADALLIPAEALVMEKANAFAFVADAQKAKKTAIKLGFNDGAMVEVLQGLKGSEAIILVGKQTFTDGQPVIATEAK